MTEMNVGYLITARLKSTRLPNKLLREIKGKPILCHMLDRLKMAKRVGHIVICTSDHPQDQPLLKIAKDNGVGCFLGDPDDVLARLYGAAKANQFDYVLNITADCPFADPVYADKIVEVFEDTEADLIRAFDLPHGAFSYGIKPAALQKIMEIKEDRETEVWGRYFTDTDLFTVYDLPIENALHRWPDLRMTLDYPADLAFFEAVFDQLYRENHIFSLDEILLLLRRRPEIVQINQHCARQFLKRLRGQSEIYLKRRYEVKKAAVIGSGSIGQRHIRNLRTLGITDIMALRTREGHHKDLPSDLGIHEVFDWQELLEQGADIAIVSNPTSMHMETVSRLLPFVRGILVEKPLGQSIQNLAQFISESEKSRVILIVGYNLVFHEAIRAVRKFLARSDIGEPLCFQAQVGHWLPAWHPYEDFTQAYYARKDLGGGVIRTLSHEVHLAQYFFGEVASICTSISPSDALPLEVDTIADMMMRHKSGVISQLHLDFVQQPSHRSGLITCERGWVRYDLANGTVHAQTEKQPTPELLWQGKGYDPNQQYLDEMKTFLRFVQEGRIRHSFDAREGAHTMAIIDAAFLSARNGKIAKVVNLVPAERF